ncbi:hypothetical protein ACJMK2_044706 [Sinanodonta woodiana]|uniref:C2H2-type domain-containing protein n=1 Tax=Sinanodonta woodiana TaxID=1069815 RepID=A0ABD3W289_SINWO
MKPLEAIRCTYPSCPCECFAPGKASLRNCETCKHGWVVHALDKLGYRHIFNLGIQVEIVQPNIVFDIASLMLYGAQATPIRLKILLDRLFSVLQHDEVLQVLHGFGWSYEDYARGYILQDAAGRVLDKWTIATREEEHIILQQFLRFGETKSIAQEIILQDNREKQDLYVKQTTRNESEIKRFIERSNMTSQTFIRPFDTRHLFGNRFPFVPPGSRLMSPPTMPSFSPPSSRDLRPPVVTVQPSSPLSTSPLGRLQTMQPLDFKREHASPSNSPVMLDKIGTNQTAQSPTSDSPQNLSTTSTSGHSTPPSHTPHLQSESSESPTQSSTSTVVSVAGSVILPTIHTPTEEKNCALNFSIKDDEMDHQSSFYSDRKAKHLRKSANPIKRQWMPNASFGTSFMGPNGKKRVLCSACNKTFCDKGALKIHYSAVHLKEMHKCTVEGCNMMFSSRRSRNRHSANPNPKLHMPQKRAKLPDGASIVDDGTGQPQRNLGSTSPSMIISSSLMTQSPIHPIDGVSELSHGEIGFYPDPSLHIPIFPTPTKTPASEDDEEGPKDLSLSYCQKPVKRLKLDELEDEGPTDLSIPLPVKRKEEEISEQKDTDSGSSEEEKMESGTTRTGSRRKNIPSRCAQAEDTYPMSDDNSDDKDPCTGGSRNNRKKESRMHEQVKNGKCSPHQESGQERHKKSAQEDGKDSEDVKMNGMDIDDDEKEGYLMIDALDTDVDQDIERGDREVMGNLHSSRMEVDDRNSFPSNLSQDQRSSASPVSSEDQRSEISSNIGYSTDADSPYKCAICSRVFSTEANTKTHYQNVHLKLMHCCTVEGCNATFLSKKSRDRHSCNSSLHRKLLSTTDNSVQRGQDLNQNHSAEIQNKINSQVCDIKDSKQNNSALSNGGKKCLDEESENGIMIDCNEHSNGINGHDVETNGETDEIGEAEKDSDGMVTCHICEVKVKDNMVLKEHFELVHPKEMFGCTVADCRKIFSTRKSRNRHSQNDSLHCHLGNTAAKRS